MSLDTLRPAEVLSRLDGVCQNGDGWRARCPAHDDGRPSLSVHEGADGKVLLRCFAGCTFEAIVAALGLSPADRSPKKAPTSVTARIVAEYDYTDEHGGLLYQVVRFEPKDFRQRRPDGAGGWTYKLGDVRRVLFGLPALLNATDVYIVEGEKDVLTLRALGLPATTNAGGSKAWRDDYVQQLARAGALRVTILPDNDDAGRAYADAVARSCHAAGLQVRIVTLPNLSDKGDVSDWCAAGGARDALQALVQAAPVWALATVTDEPAESRPARSIRLTPASAITVKPVRWLWQDRVPAAALSLEAGREGIGKSIHTSRLTADVTRGRLNGAYQGTPRSVIIAASEDSWEHTIVPRLLAADADLDRVFRVDVETADLIETSLSLPKDLPALETAIVEADVALVVLDPLMSRLDGALDTHKDSEVRRALEPLVALAGRTGVAVLGLIHVNKSSTTDPLTSLMGSRAFAAVARAVLFVMTDPEDEHARLLGQAKNNLGRMDLPTLSFRVVGAHVADTADGPVWTGKLEWTGEASRSIREALDVAAESSGDRSAGQEAGDWLSDYLTEQGGTAESRTIKEEGRKAGHSADALKRARRLLRIQSDARGFPRRTYWLLPPVGATAGRLHPTAPTAPTGETYQTHTHPLVPVGAVGAVGAVGGTLPNSAPTDMEDGDALVC